MPAKKKQEIVTPQDSQKETEKQSTSEIVTANGDDTQKTENNGVIAKFEGAINNSKKIDGTIKNVDNAIGFILPNRENYQYDNEVVQNSSGPIKFGIWLFLIVFIVIGGWATFAPLNSAAIATGKVMLDSNTKTIDHLEGGIIASFSVKDGDIVEKGDELLRFDNTKAKASMEIHSIQLYSNMAKRARLVAERDAAENIEFSQELTDKSDNHEIADIIKSESNLFIHRRNSINGQIAILKQRGKQFEEEIGGLEAQKSAGETQLSLITEEVEVVEKLVKDGRAIRPRLLSLQRDAASVKGRIGEHTALIARARQSIAETELSIIKLNDDFLSDISKQLNESQLQIADLRERITAAKDILDRIVIKAPTSGIVTGLAYHTVGGTVPPGKPIMSLVPQDDEKIILAHIAPQDIDVVHPGLKANVRISAYRARQVPALDGEVISVSPDSFVNQNTGAQYYEARIRLDKEKMDMMDEKIELRPGMGAEVIIVTGERTPLRYMIDPIISSTRRAFKEQ